MREINIKVNGAFTFKAVQNKRMSFEKGEVVKFTMEQDKGNLGKIKFSLPKQEVATITFAYKCDTTYNKILKLKRVIRPSELTWADITTRVYQ